MKQINTIDYWNNKYQHKSTGGKWGEKGYYFLRDILPKNESFTLLDVGCGKGAGIGFLHQLFPKGHMEGIDFSDHGIKIAREKFPVPNVNFHVNDAYKVKGNYDYILMIEVLEHFRKPNDVIENALKICNKAIYISIPINNWPCDEHIYAYGDPKKAFSEYGAVEIGDIDGRKKIKIEVNK